MYLKRKIPTKNVPIIGEKKKDTRSDWLLRGPPTCLKGFICFVAFCPSMYLIKYVCLSQL